MTVRELLERIDSRELTEWRAFYELEPFGCEKEDSRIGVIAATIANVFRAKRGKTYKVEDFMPLLPTGKKQSVEEMKQIFTELAKETKKNG